MINQINEKLKAMGSNFRTEDGTTLVMHVGNLIFLKRRKEFER